MAQREIEHAELRRAHADLVALIGGIGAREADVREEYEALVRHLGNRERWLLFAEKGEEFVRLCHSLGADAVGEGYAREAEWVDGFLAYASRAFAGEGAVPREGLDERVSAIYTVLRTSMMPVEMIGEEAVGYRPSLADFSNRLLVLAREIDALYGAASPEWHRSEEERAALREKVSTLVRSAGIDEACVTALAPEIERLALLNNGGKP